MTSTPIQQWIDSRFPPYTAAVFWQQYRSAQDAIERIGAAAIDFPAQKDLLLWSMAVGLDGESSVRWMDEGLAPRWGSRRPVWPHQSVIYPTGDPTQPDVSGTVEWIRKAMIPAVAAVQAPYVFLDLEGDGFFPVDYPNMKMFPEAISRTAKLIRELKEQLEDDVKVGIWGHYPLSSINYWNYPNPEVQDWMLKHCRDEGAVFREAEWICPMFYVEPLREGVEQSFTAEQTAHAIEQTITVARSYNPNLLVTPCLMTERYKTWQEQQAPDTPEKILVRAMPADYFRTILEPCFDLGDGAMLWMLQPLKDAERPVFSWELPWIPAVEEYLARHGVMPWSVLSHDED